MTLCAVLAGGASLRFGVSKLSWSGRDGRPLLVRVINAVEESGVCGRVVIVASKLTASEVKELLGDSHEIILDPDYVPCRGPLKGMTAAAIEAGRSSIQFVAGDMAWITPSSLARLVEVARGHGADAATPMWRTGYIQPIGGYVEDSGLVLSTCIRRGLYGRATDVYRGANRLLLIGSSLLGDSDGRVFMSVNTVEEALNPSPHPPGKGLIDASLATEFYREAVKVDSILGPLSAYAQYFLEALEYHRLGVSHLAKYAWQDTCEAMRRLGHSEERLKSAPFNACRRRGRGGFYDRSIIGVVKR